MGLRMFKPVLTAWQLIEWVLCTEAKNYVGAFKCIYTECSLLETQESYHTSYMCATIPCVH